MTKTNIKNNKTKTTIVTALVLAVILSSSSMIVTANALPQKLHLQHLPFVVPTNHIR
jgi:hypothetical protein